MSPILTIVIFFAVIAVSVVVFGGWVIFLVMRALFNGMAWLLDIPRTSPVQLKARQSARCDNKRCLRENPTAAQFCRRCGSPLPQVQRVAVRRAAVW